MKPRLLLAFLLLPIIFYSQTFPERPRNYITDDAEILTEQQLNTLNAKCKRFEDSTTNQLFVYVAKSLNGQDMTVLCHEIFSKWGIGQPGKDNGVLVGIFIEDRAFRIQTGYGLEGALPDITTKMIQDEYMKPHFKQQNYYEGISEGIDQLIYYSAHEYTPEPQNNNGTIIFLLIFAGFCYLINGFFLWAIRSSIKDNEKLSAKTKNVLYIIAWVFFAFPFAGAFLMGIMGAIFGKRKSGGGGSGGSGSSWRSSSSWSSSSSSGSSFSGGGGGRSGGGGSSSSW